MSRSTVLPEDSAPPWRGFFFAPRTRWALFRLFLLPAALDRLRDLLWDGLGRAEQRCETKNYADWPNVAVHFKMLVKWRVGLTLGLERSLMHGVAPQMCGQVVSPLLGLGAGGRSPGYLIAPRLAAPA